MEAKKANDAILKQKRKPQNDAYKIMMDKVAENKRKIAERLAKITAPKAKPAKKPLVKTPSKQLTKPSRLSRFMATWKKGLQNFKKSFTGKKSIPAPNKPNKLPKPPPKPAARPPPKPASNSGNHKKRKV
jgi:hypothetical protein